jgi:hypothetical protein
MRATEAWRQSFGARMTAANALLDAATKDLTLEQVNHKEREGVLSIAFSLAHVVGGQDRNVASLIDGGSVLWDRGGWAGRVGYTGEMPRRGTPMSIAEKIAFTDRDPNAGGSFLYALVPSGPIRVLEAVEAYLFQHAARHLGEIEHARALAGLGGIS